MKTNASHRKSIRAADRRLARLFGEPRNRLRRDPVATLVGCILSQATTDAQSGAAYDALRAHYPTWAQVRDAPERSIARLIKSGGLGNEKARYIKRALHFIERERGRIELGFLKKMPVDAAKKWLMQLEGVGPKTAAIVLLFALQMPAFPVDTHVYRVTRRLGWLGGRDSPERAHEILGAAIPPSRYYPLHINLIRLGREICVARAPRCEMCPLTDLCEYYRRTSTGRLEGL